MSGRNILNCLFKSFDFCEHVWLSEHLSLSFRKTGGGEFIGDEGDERGVEIQWHPVAFPTSYSLSDFLRVLHDFMEIISHLQSSRPMENGLFVTHLFSYRNLSFAVKL